MHLCPAGPPSESTLRFERSEVDAVHDVSRVEAERAAMEGGTGNLGGFALPVEVDPTILLTSEGVINPIRALATVRTSRPASGPASQATA